MGQLYSRSGLTYSCASFLGASYSRNCISKGVGGNYFGTMMDSKQARDLGRQQTIRWTLYTFIVVELTSLYTETIGDFANGILFYIQDRTNIHYLAMVTILFTITYFTGQRNGYEILILKNNFFVTPFKYGLLTIWIVLIYVSAYGMTHQAGSGSVSATKLIQRYILEQYAWTTLIFLVPLAVYSYFCGNSIKKREVELSKK